MKHEFTMLAEDFLPNYGSQECCCDNAGEHIWNLGKPPSPVSPRTVTSGRKVNEDHSHGRMSKGPELHAEQ